MRLQIGDYTLTLVSDGFFSIDGGTMFGIIPKTIWGRLVTTDEKNRTKLALNSLLIQYKNKNVLVNAGIGEKFNKKYEKIYKIDHQETITSSLKKINLSPEDIDFIIFTHLHLDHCGGATRFENGKSIPLFPRAQYIIQKAEWESATHPNELTKGSYLQDNILPLKERLILIEGDISLTKFGAPGIKLIKTGGHSDGHQIIEVTANGKKAVYLSDLIPTSKHIPLPYLMAYDIDSLQVLNKKRALLKKSVDENYLIIWEHDPEYFYSKIGFYNGNYFAKDSVKL